MKIRTQLFLLVVAVVAPIAILAAITTERMWTLQRAAYEQKFLERVSALRLALDTELDATKRTLQTLAGVPDLDSPRGLKGFTERFQRLLANNPMWSTIGLTAADGKPIARLDKMQLPADAGLDAKTIAAIAASRAAAVSDLITVRDGATHLTYVAVPVLRAGEVKGLLYIGMEHQGWLEFLKRYPVSEQATLTLNDRDARIIARTLNNERWVGKVSSPAFWDRTKGRAEGSFISPGLEGQKFYSAFSRSRSSAWVLGTGVPQEEVEAALGGPTVATFAAIIIALSLAIFFALLLGGRIAAVLTALADAAKATGRGEPEPGERLEIDEAETVRRALADASIELRTREQLLNEALAGEARMRAHAERDSQAKDQFLAMLGHELRNPLSAMSTAATLLEMASDKPEVAQRAREVLQRQLRHLTGIIDDMLDVARLTSGKVVLSRQVLDLARVARHVAESFRDAGRCAHLSLETRFDSALVYADETRLEQVISNLLDNACKYTPAGRKVRIETGASNGHALLSVSDQGSGIAADLLPHIFDIFSQGSRTLDRAQGGLGLGLTVVRRLVELHGGSVSASSDGPDRGATLRIRLPRAQDAQAPEAPRAAARPLAPQRIVIVEDRADNRESIAAVLKMKGHEVTEAEDGPRGLSAILSAKPDVALVDLGLPGLDGLQIARQVRAAGSGNGVVLIALTGYGSASDRNHALDAGFDGYLIKPFDIAKFEAAVSAGRR